MNEQHKAAVGELEQHAAQLADLEQSVTQALGELERLSAKRTHIRCGDGTLLMWSDSDASCVYLSTLQ